jgi:hypothetical protein
MFFTTVTHRADHRAMLTGTFSCGALSQDPFMVLRGTLQLFNDDPRTPDTKNISYDFDIVSTNGQMFHFHGYKVIDSSIAFAPWRTWKAVSTLYVTITHLKDNSIVGRGVLRIAATNIGNELASSSITGSSLISRARAAGLFLSYFVLQIAKFFFAPFTSLGQPDVLAAEDMHKISPAEIIQIVACDGVKTTLRMWTPVISKDATQLPSDVPILFIPGAAVDHNIFAAPTIKVNAIEFFTTSGATCFCVTLRVGKTAVAKAGWTTYDARLDVAAALNHITGLYPPGTKVYVVAHCIGSLALSMGLLDGTIPAGSIKGITASQVFMNPKAAAINMLKAKITVPFSAVYGSLEGQWFSCVSNPEDSVFQKILNQVLRFYPVGSTKEMCNSVICHRCELIFGRYVDELRSLAGRSTRTDKPNFKIPMQALESP